MDNNILSIIALVISFIGTVCAVINHKRLRSKCLTDREMVVSVDIEDTTNTTNITPKTPKVRSNNDLTIKIPESRVV
jgi:hypothetical protein